LKSKVERINERCPDCGEGPIFQYLDKQYCTRATCRWQKEVLWKEVIPEELAILEALRRIEEITEAYLRVEELLTYVVQAQEKMNGEEKV